MVRVIGNRFVLLEESDELLHLGGVGEQGKFAGAKKVGKGLSWKLF